MVKAKNEGWFSLKLLFAIPVFTLFLIWFTLLIWMAFCMSMTSPVFFAQMKNGSLLCCFVIALVGYIITGFSQIGSFVADNGTKLQRNAKIIVYVLSFLTIGFCVLTLLCSETYTGVTRDWMRISITRDYDNGLMVQGDWNEFQTRTHCCGVRVNNSEPYEVWRQTQTFSNGPPYVPLSCCLQSYMGNIKNRTECLNQAPSNLTIYTKDCMDASNEILVCQFGILGFLALLTLFLLIWCHGISALRSRNQERTPLLSSTDKNINAPPEDSTSPKNERNRLKDILLYFLKSHSSVPTNK